MNATALLDLKPSEIAVHPRNPRLTVGDVADLAASISEHGVIEPLIVAPWPDAMKATTAQKKKHLLIAGHRRLAAAIQAKSPDVPCILRADLDTEEKQLEAMLVENLHRADLTPVEEAEAYQALLEFPGFTQARLAKDIGQPVARIRERLKLVKLEAPVRDQLHRGQLTITDALAIGEFGDDSKATKDLLKVAGTDQFKWTLERARQDRVAAAKLASRLEVYRAAGVSIVKTKPAGFTAISTLFDKAPSPYADEKKFDAWVVKHHGQCPGAVLFDGKMQTYESPRLHPGCSQPKLHPKPKVTKTKAQAEQEQAAAEEKARLKTDTATAAVLRRGHLEWALNDPAGIDELAVKRLTALIFAKQYGPGDFDTDRKVALANLLGVKNPENAKGVIDAVLLLEISKLSLPQLAVLLDISEHWSAEDDLASIGWISFAAGGENARWVEALAFDYGYEWSDFERDQFNLAVVLGTTAESTDVDELPEDADNGHVVDETPDVPGEDLDAGDIE